MTTNTNRLENISARHRRSRLFDIVFAASVALASVVSLTSVAAVAHAGSTSTLIAR